MRPRFETLLAALSPADPPGDLWEIRLGGGCDSLQRPWIPDDRVVRPGIPSDGGTLAPVILGLLEILGRDAEAVVLVGAGDHRAHELLGAIARVVAHPGQVALLRPQASTIAEGFGFACEARVLLGLLREIVPSWTGILLDAARDGAALEELRYLPRADIEPVVRLANLRPVGVSDGIAPGGTTVRVGLA